MPIPAQQTKKHLPLISCILVALIFLLLSTLGFFLYQLLKQGQRINQLEQGTSTSLPETGEVIKYIQEGQENAVDTSMLVDNSVTNINIAEGAVETENISDESVTTAKIATGTIQFSDLNQNACANGQVMKWSSALSSWICANDELGESASDETILLSEDQIEAYIFDDDNTGILTSGTLALDSLSFTGSIIDTYISDALTISSLGTVDKGAILGGILGFDWVDNEVIDALTITGGTIGSNSISGILTTTGALIIGDAGDDISIDSSSWDISTVGVGTGFTALTADNINIDGNTIAATNNGGLYLYDDASSGIFIEDGGQVGIGTTGPSYKLDVNGDIQVQGGDLYITGQASSGSTTEGTIYYDTDDYQLKVYANGKWQSDRTTATVIVGTSNGSGASRNYEKADYVCGATDCDSTIESAISALPSGGGAVVLLEGTYVIDNPIDIDTDYVSLIGMGEGSILQRGGTGRMINLGTSPNAITIASLTLDGNEGSFPSSGNVGIYFTQGTVNLTIRDILFQDHYDHAIDSYAATSPKDYANTISNNRFYSNNSIDSIISIHYNIRGTVISDNVFYVNHGNYAIDNAGNDSSITGNTFYWNYIDLYVIRISGDFNTITGNTIGFNDDPNFGPSGILVTGIQNSITSNTLTYNDGTGIGISGDYNTVVGNALRSNDGSAISVSSSGNIISSNNIYHHSGGSYYGINVSAGSNNYLASNEIGGAWSSEVNDSGTGTTIQHRDQFAIDANGDIALAVTQAGSADIVNVFDDTTEVFTILDGGNVGIGTTSPLSKLQVDGYVQIDYSTDAPVAADCDEASETARMFYESDTDILWICQGASGWQSH